MGLIQRLLFKLARKWISGSTYENALSTARNTNNNGMFAILNFLGEETTNSRIIENTVKEYLSLLDMLKNERIDGCVSVKPTQVGLRTSYDECLCNFRQIAEKAKSLDRFMWMDMESFPFVEDTIAIYLELLKDYKHTIGLAMQSYLKRSDTDLLYLLEQGASIRLVKGAYEEDKSIAFQSMKDIDSNFSKLMKMLLTNRNTHSTFAIATHDSKLIDEAIALSKKYNMDRRKFEFQLLMGIRDEIKQNLVKRGFKVSVYIPYGNQWLSYSLRRLRERKRNILLLVRSLIH